MPFKAAQCRWILPIPLPTMAGLSVTNRDVGRAPPAGVAVYGRQVGRAPLPVRCPTEPAPDGQPRVLDQRRAPTGPTSLRSSGPDREHMRFAETSRSRPGPVLVAEVDPCRRVTLSAGGRRLGCRRVPVSHTATEHCSSIAITPRCSNGRRGWGGTGRGSGLSNRRPAARLTRAQATIRVFFLTDCYCSVGVVCALMCLSFRLAVVSRGPVSPVRRVEV